MRATRVVVLPVPAPAMTAKGPGRYVTAASCSGSSPGIVAWAIPFTVPARLKASLTW